MQKVFLMLMGLALILPAAAVAEPVQVKLSERTTLVLPLQLVRGTQLYAPKEGKGYPAVETVLATLKSKSDPAVAAAQLTFGAAPELGTSNHVPFLGLQVRLPERFFDVSDNQIMFGVWVGRTSARVEGKRRVLWGLQASIPLW